jgi:hypothetical protein
MRALTRGGGVRKGRSEGEMSDDFVVPLLFMFVILCMSRSRTSTSLVSFLSAMMASFFDTTFFLSFFGFFALPPSSFSSFSSNSFFSLASSSCSFSQTSCGSKPEVGARFRRMIGMVVIQSLFLKRRFQTNFPGSLAREISTKANQRGNQRGVSGG